MNKLKFKSENLIIVRREPVYYRFDYRMVVDGKVYKFKADNLRFILPN